MMFVHAAWHLVLDEESRVERLADIMEQRSDTCQQRVGTDSFGGLFRKVGYLQAVLVCARRAAQEELQQRRIGSGNIEQLQGGRETKGLGEEILKQERDTRSSKTQ